MDSKTSSHILGESIAKLYFELNNYFVYTNSSGKAEFDLLLSKDGNLFSVEVKTVSVEKTSTKGSFFEVQLKSVRSNKTSNSINKFDNSFVDYLAVVDIASCKIAVFDATEINNTGSMRVYSNRFAKLGTLAESA